MGIECQQKFIIGKTGKCPRACWYKATQHSDPLFSNNERKMLMMVAKA